MKKLLMTMAAAGLAISVGAANAAEKKTLAVVVKGLDNGFFTVMGKGCAKWNEDHKDLEYQCLYTGPALTSDEAGEIQPRLRPDRPRRRRRHRDFTVQRSGHG